MLCIEIPTNSLFKSFFSNKIIDFRFTLKYKLNKADLERK